MNELKNQESKLPTNIPSCTELAGDQSVGKMLETIILDALEKKASDIHFEPQEKSMIVRYRIDGILVDICTVPKDMEDALVFKVKVSAKLRTDEHYAPQDGRLTFTKDGTKIDIRVSIIRVNNGEKIVFRLLTKEGRSFTLEDLGLRDNDLVKVKKGYMKPYGMIIAVGPTGCGKTTTLYTILKILNTREKNITTVEDPVEYNIPGINHIQINPKANLTFANGLRSILRQDPDIIMIGEIRDSETAKIAVNAAMTGHLVLSTLHTNDSVTTIPRLLDMGVESYLVSSTLNLVIAQRLVRTICKDCKKQKTLTEERFNEINKLRPDVGEFLKPNETIYEGSGCSSCNDSGYRGRVGLFEVFELNKDIRDLVAEESSSDQIFEAARKNGLMLVVEDGVKKVREGLTTIDELLRVTAVRE